jgi:FAD/FMN-containing dehydrogenase
VDTPDTLASRLPDGQVVLKAGFLAAELGPAGVGVLAAIKAALDPDQIMNPGALLP